MGRELRRVPLDFAHPLRKVWPGFCNPHGGPCPETAKGNCINGYTAAGDWLNAITRLIALIGEEALVEPHAEELRKNGRIYPHPWLRDWPQAPRVDLSEQLLPFGSAHGSELATLIRNLADGRSPGGSSAAHVIRRTLVQAAKLDPATWGICKVCGGHGDDPARRAEADAWRPTPPPLGEGWQLWETVSDGSPISPVFPTQEKFVQYLVAQGYSLESARAFSEKGWAPSGMIIVNEDGTREEYRDIDAVNR